MGPGCGGGDGCAPPTERGRRRAKVTLRWGGWGSFGIYVRGSSQWREPSCRGVGPSAPRGRGVTWVGSSLVREGGSVGPGCGGGGGCARGLFFAYQRARGALGAAWPRRHMGRFFVGTGRRLRGAGLRGRRWVRSPDRTGAATSEGDAALGRVGVVRDLRAGVFAVARAILPRRGALGAAWPRRHMGRFFVGTGRRLRGAGLRGRRWERSRFLFRLPAGPWGPRRRVAAASHGSVLRRDGEAAPWGRAAGAEMGALPRPNGGGDERR